ncbi:sensor histidine kinase [Peribacillus butanolivorans]|uniref:sensor histidine kinase n=1 Tax=Peribacillus butanolivorans TaxID=421767 RepID=UPI0036C9E3D4
MNKLTLRLRLTFLTGCILVAITICLTIISINNVDNTFVQPNLNKKMLDRELMDQENSLNKKIIDDHTFDENQNNGITAHIEVIEAQKQFNDQSIMWMITIIVVGIVTTYLIAGRALKPVSDLSRNVKSINEHNLSQRIENINTKDEIGDLAISYNKMLDRLEKSFMYQKNFAANAAHELKTPLTIIKAGIQVLKLDKSPTLEDYKGNIYITEQSTQRLIQVVDDLLALASEQTEELSNNIELKNLFETISDELHPLCVEKNTNIYLDICNENIIGNQTLLYRVFFNLIENAVKYNHNNGTVRVIARVNDDNITISISDTGIGIPKEVLPLIFEPFYRVDKSRTRQLGGSGLGLSIVKTIVEKHKGTISVKSTLNVGTTFEVNLPRK